MVFFGNCSKVIVVIILKGRKKKYVGGDYTSKKRKEANKYFLFDIFLFFNQKLVTLNKEICETNK